MRWVWGPGMLVLTLGLAGSLWTLPRQALLLSALELSLAGPALMARACRQREADIVTCAL